MDTSYADAVLALEDAVYHACNVAQEHLSHAEIAAELRRLAQGWEDSA